MTQIVKSLDEITTEYSVFEKDQVLTASQLNSVSSYFEDQTRLTRTQLLGVGIVCGLNITLDGKQITVSQGTGITTDGDLLTLLDDTAFTHFKIYDTTNPVYPPFYKGESILPLFQLVPAEPRDKRSFPLVQFSEKTDLKLESMVALLFMESYLFDPDLCEGTDCNNVGKKMINNTKVLLVSPEYLGMLQPVIPTPHAAYTSLDEIFADRPIFNKNIKSHAQLVLQYRNVCNTINGKLISQFTKIYPSCAFFLQDIFPGDPSKNWVAILEKWYRYYLKNETGIQYYYDFLRDLTDTYNAFHELLANDETWCNPDRNEFPKHLILGSLYTAAEAVSIRTPLYRSPLTSHTLQQKLHAKFLANKLNTLILTFRPPVTSDNNLVRITPSKSTESTLEKRAIPYFYQIDKALPSVAENWNFKLHQKNKGAFNYSYNAGLFGAQGAAASPLSAQIGSFDFFRIEGHLGQNIVKVHQFLENEISTNNLPINLRSVLLGEDIGRVVVRPPVVFNDIYRLHNLLRMDLVNQLDEVKRFSSELKTKVKANLELLDQADRGTFSQIADGRDNELSTSIDQASSRLKGTYEEYEAANTEADSWRNHVSNAMEKAGTFKGQLSAAAKTEFNTPIDSLLGNRHIDLLDHLDSIIINDRKKKLRRLLFDVYIAGHPGLEHYAGVQRGGTFVLVYDENGLIVADFMLPYQETDAEKNDLLEPDINIKTIRPNYVIDGGLSILSPVDRKIRGQLDEFKLKDLDAILNIKTEGIKSQLNGDWNTRFNEQQKDYFSTIKESFGTLSNVLSKRTAMDAGILDNALNMKDSALQNTVRELRSKREVLASYNARAAQSTDAAEKKRYTDLAGAIEQDLSDSLSSASQAIADSGQDVSVGTDGFTALMEINSGLGSISNNALLTKTTSNITKLAGATRKASFNLIIGNITNR